MGDKMSVSSVLTNCLRSMNPYVQYRMRYSRNHPGPDEIFEQFLEYRLFQQLHGVGEGEKKCLSIKTNEYALKIWILISNIEEVIQGIVLDQMESSNNSLSIFSPINFTKLDKGRQNVGIISTNWFVSIVWIPIFNIQGDIQGIVLDRMESWNTSSNTSSLFNFMKFDDED